MMVRKAPNIMLNNNNAGPKQSLCLTVLLTFLIFACSAPPKHSNQVQDLSKLTLHHQEQNYHLTVNIGHHALKLWAELQAGKSWIKEALCKQCDLETDQCSKSCFKQKDAPKVSCDSSFCSEQGQYNDENRGIAGKEAEVFLKISDDSQVLMPLVFADKLYQEHSEQGVFKIFDEQSSFSHGFIARSPLSSIELYNINKIAPDELAKMRQNEGTALNVSMAGDQFDFTFLKVKKVILHHVDDKKYVDFEDDSDQFDVNFSLQALPITIPLKLAKKIQKYLNENYLADKKCRLLPRKLKCSGELDMQEVFRIVLHLQLNQYQLAVPLHLLITACSANECNTLLNFHELQSEVTFGYVIWELYNLEYNIEGKYAIFHRRSSQFDDLFLLDRVQLSKVGFLTGMFLIVYHTCKYIFVILFWLALFSLAVNLVMKWRSVLGWLRQILLRRKRNRIAQTEEEHFEERPFRRINKLPDHLQDSETI